MSQELKGLSPKEAKKRLDQYGPNKIKRTQKISPIKILLSQFKSPLIIILIIAAIISSLVNYYEGEAYTDSFLIVLIVLISGIAGFVQDYKAEKAIEALKKMASPKAKVMRGGKEIEIKASQLVPGDIILLEGGDVVPADAKILKGRAEINEAVLTGESRAVHKEKDGSIYSSCSILSGHIKAEIYATGMKTKVGRIAEEMQTIREEKTPFQKHMHKFSNKLVASTGLVIFLTFLVGWGKFGWLETGLIAVSLAVAAIPEGLPAVITLSLSLGAKGMVAQNALIRKLTTTESIGSINTICTDKTGTLTQGDMKVDNIWSPAHNKAVKKISYQCAYYCNDAKQIYKEGEKKWVGDETEIALKKYAREHIEKEGEKEGEISFTSERKMMSVMQVLDKNKWVFTKGAPEVVIKKCDKVLTAQGVKKISEKEKKEILEQNEKLASQGYRILSLAYKKSGELTEENLVFASLVYLNDPVTKEVKKAIQECKQAGIRIIMITGDNPLTAQAVAKKINIKTKNVYIGEDLDKMEGAKIDKLLAQGNNIFARTSPFHKLKILTSLQNQGQVVAMTGDGVNDALALKKSNVGVAMGIKGTEVSKQASDIILLDDNFATIKNAIREGRKIFDNIRKFVNYLLSCNLAEVLVILVAILSLPFVVLYPVQILWINLVTDGIVALALSVDPAKPDIMKRKPREKKEGIINKKLGIIIIARGILMTLVLLALLFTSLRWGEEKARSLLFSGFILIEFAKLGLIKHNEKLKSIKEWFANKFLIYSILASFALQLLILYTPLAYYFKIVPLSFLDWGVILAYTLIFFVLGIIINRLVDKFTPDK